MSIYEKNIKNRIILLLGRNSQTLDFIERLSTTGDLLFFGGSIRDLCLFPECTQIPRDFDIAINFKNKERFDTLIGEYNFSKNRFGGFKFNISNIEFDIWDLNNTWAFKNKYLKPSEENLAKSVYLNIDGIVYNFNKNRLYDDIFQSSIKSSKLDITLEENPQVELNLLRALVFKNKYNLIFSNKLKDVFKTFMNTYDEDLIESLYEMQLAHYRYNSFSKEEIRKELQFI
ncbi:hypothetical protein [Brevibacillus brevis]|uniref:hypothetical protein n=1 Tax=Brevibacillus brevis TaxID=1393 RepID=UPI000D0EC900|nr:hypothetical protein [Brevibacillus brevis]PSJ63517.1 hypothetical protein C7J99_31120 [Brevibacillus brevis]RED33883.1 hypothetical protein DES34_10248 [Brevibacillus brevis]GEC89393.1 hypothetical protein BBR01nite_17240 [Brevibacillus brevis]VEF92547.1 Uncharacterised protein [Brevibacillus brevis]